MNKQHSDAILKCRDAANKLGLSCQRMLTWGDNIAEPPNPKELDIKIVDLLLAISDLVEAGVISNEAIESVVMGYSESIKKDLDRKVDIHENQINILFKNLTELTDEVKRLRSDMDGVATLR